MRYSQSFIPTLKEIHTIVGIENFLQVMEQARQLTKR